MFEISDLKEKKLPDLQEIAQSLGMKKFKTLKKEELIYRIIDFQAENPAPIQPPQVANTQEEKKEKTTGKAKKKEARPPKENNKKDSQLKENKPVAVENKDTSLKTTGKTPEQPSKENKGK